MPQGSCRGTVYGLLIESNRPIPGLGNAQRTGDPDLAVEFGPLPPAARPGETPSLPRNPGLWPADALACPLPGGGVYLRFEDGCEFAVDAQATHVWSSWPDPLALADAAIYLLGPVLATVLRRRGTTVVHASALAGAHGGVALVGPAGAGKSTTAAVLAERGLRVLTDDVLALVPTPAGVTGLPGPAVLRLWDDSAEALFGASGALPLITPHWDKRYLDVADRWHSDAAPIGTVYLLAAREPRNSPRVEPVPPAEALLALVGNTYHGWLSEREHRARDLALLGELVRRARVRRLVPHDDAAALPALADLIQADLSRAD